jgi:hypothetical protein
MAARMKRSGKVNRRSEILRAAEMLMHSRGLSGVTTRIWRSKWLSMSRFQSPRAKAIHVRWKWKYDPIVTGILTLKEEYPRAYPRVPEVNEEGDAESGSRNQDLSFATLRLWTN